MKRKSSNKILIHYVIPLGNGWAVKSTNSSRFMLITDRKPEAVQVARELAKKDHAKLVVQSRQGKVISRKDYAIAG